MKENKHSKKLEGFSKFYNFSIRGEDIRVWRCYSIGSGKFFSLQVFNCATAKITVAPYHGAIFPHKRVSSPLTRDEN